MNDNPQALTLDQMRQDIAEAVKTPVAEITDEDHLGDLGLDSIGFMRLLMKWEEVQPNIETAKLYEAETIAEFWDIIRSTQK